MPKTNIDYLRDFIVDNDEANEFLDAIQEELEDSISLNKELKSDKKDLESEISDLEMEIDRCQSQSHETIRCGIGDIEYIEPDNLKLQMIMSDFKEQLEKKALFGAGV